MIPMRCLSALSALLILVLLAGCGLPGVNVVEAPTSDSAGKVEQASRTALSASTSATPKETMTAPPSAAASASPAEPMLIAVGSRGTVNTLTENGWSTFNTGADYCFGATANFDTVGNARILCDSKVFVSANGTTWNPFREDEFYTSMFVDTRNRLWLVGSEIARMLDNGNMQVFLAEDAIDQKTFLGGFAMAATPDGSVYIAGLPEKNSPNQMVSYDGEKWTTYGNKLGLPGNGYISTLFFTARGELLAGVEGAIYKFDGTQFNEWIANSTIKALVGEERYAQDINRFFQIVAEKMIELPDGRILMATSAGLLVWNAGQVSLLTTKDGLPSNQLEDIALDSDGNVWVATQQGVATNAGGTWQTALPSTSGLAASRITALAVRGTPTLPRPAPIPRTATIKGKVAKKDGPGIANVRVELCSEFPRLLANGPDDNRPCAEHLYSQQVQTDDQGNYRFEQVPVGSYVLIVQAEPPNWTAFLDGNVDALQPSAEVTKDLTLSSE